MIAAVSGWLAATAAAHPDVQNSLDVVVGPERIEVDARITVEEIGLVENGGNGPSKNGYWRAAVERHADYVRRHVHIWADGRELSGRPAIVDPQAGFDPSGKAAAGGTAPEGNSPDDDSAAVATVRYHLTYSLAAPPREIEIRHDFLQEFAHWSASCMLCMRQSGRPDFAMSLVERNEPAKFICDWSAAHRLTGDRPAADPTATADAARTDVPFWATFRAYAGHGIEHIPGYDHLLFAAALVLAAGRLWDLVKIVSVFTLAHTLTLALSVFNVVTLRSSIVEPMIAASIVFVAVQNIVWPERSTGRLRLAIGFGFGLFHGLGFAGGLKEAMGEMPSAAVWLALVAFSLGVEIGHQIVVLPLFSLLSIARSRETDHSPMQISSRLLKFGSLAIALAGGYYLIESLR